MSKEQVAGRLSFAEISRTALANAELVSEKEAALRELNRRLTEVEEQEARLDEKIEALGRRTTRRDELEDLRNERARVKALADQLGAEIDQAKADLTQLREPCGNNAAVSFDALLAAVDEVLEMQSEASRLKIRLASATEELVQLELAANLETPEDLSKLARLQALCAALPKRMQACTARLNGTDTVLIQWVHSFVSHELAPRGRKVANAVHTRVRSALRGELEGSELDDAVERSASVRETNEFLPSLEHNPQDGAIGYAQRMITLWKRIEAFESNLSKRRAKVVCD